ncbi:MAG: GntR family transcriptional regulator [Capsulimonadaceae bacterium]|nr:GntR family transcriptional regulator [Capsulimonadaceae bacterium]
MPDLLLDNRHVASNAVPRHVHERLRDQMYETLIAHGQPGGRLPAGRDLARQYGVSAVTIARALKLLHEEGLVESLPGKGTFISRQGWGAFPGVVQASLPSFGPGKSVAANTWIVTDLSERAHERLPEQWTHRCATALERAIQGNGGQTLLIDFGPGRMLHPYATLDEALDAGINSVALIQGMERNPNRGDLVQDLIRTRLEGRRKVAVVKVDFSDMVRWPFDSVRYDNEWGVSLAVHHLVSLGHRKIAFVGDLALPWAKRRVDLFWTTLRAFGITEGWTIPSEVIGKPNSDDLSWDGIAPVVAAEFRKSPAWDKATAVIALNDFIAVPFAKACRDAGRAIPETLSLVGCDDWMMAAAAGLTTIHPPVEEMGEAAAHLIERRLSSPQARQCDEIVLTPSLVSRRSTQPLE